MRWFWHSPILRVSTVYLISAFGITALAFFVVFPYSNQLLLGTSLNQQGLLFSFLGRIPQYLIYALVTAMFYFIVARPLRLSPVLGQSRGSLRTIVLFLCIGVTYLCVSPFDIIFTLRNGVGILTFMITGLSEEWTYRGVITRVFKERVGIAWAIVISSCLFALSHWAEVGIVGGNQHFSKGDFIGLGQNLLSGLLFGVMAWRSRSILWVAFLHCMADWQPYMSPGRQWMLGWHLPWLSMGSLQIYAIGIVGTEMIRFCSSREVINFMPFTRTT